MKQKKQHKLVVTVIILLIIVIIVTPVVIKKYNKFVYPIRYETYVSEFSSKYNVDKNFIYAVIKTESGFNSDAESNVGARGLMQIMSEAYEWIAYRMKDDRELSYDDMFDPQHNINYGTYMLKLLYEEYGAYETTIAAYHAGRTAVNNWLSDTAYSSDGKNLDKMPSSQTTHYVNKVMKAFNGYTNIYGQATQQ